MGNTKIEKEEIEQIIDQAVNGESATIMVEVNCELTEELKEVGFETMPNENGKEVTRSYFDEDNIDKLLQLIDSNRIKELYIKENDDIKIEFYELSTLTIEII